MSTEFQRLFDLPEDCEAVLLPYLPKFSHALLDLTQADPAHDEPYNELRLAMQLMKLVRTKDVGAFLEWFDAEAQRHGWPVPQALILLSYTYVLHADASIDEEQIVRSLTHVGQLRDSVMSLAQKLIATGRQEGRQEGKAVGAAMAKIQLLEQMLDRPVTAESALEAMSLAELQQRFASLEAEYSIRFKNR